GLERQASASNKKLAASTLEQHSSIFLHSYKREESVGDDTSWCPLQDLGLFEEVTADDGKTVYLVGRNAPLGLSPRVFLFSLIGYFERQNASSLSLSQIVHGEFSPGSVFRLDNFQVGSLIEGVEKEFGGVVRFIDTADTQQILLDRTLAPAWADCLMGVGDELNV
ncbi:DUF4007 family protein, partial [Pseudomonas syringae]